MENQIFQADEDSDMNGIQIKRGDRILLAGQCGQEYNPRPIKSLVVSFIIALFISVAVILLFASCKKQESNIVALPIEWKFKNGVDQPGTIQVHRADKSYNLQDIRDQDMNYLFKRGDFISIVLDGGNVYYFEFFINHSKNYKRVLLTPNQSQHTEIIIYMDQFF